MAPPETPVVGGVIVGAGDEAGLGDGEDAVVGPGVGEPMPPVGLANPVGLGVPPAIRVSSGVGERSDAVGVIDGPTPDSSVDTRATMARMRSTEIKPPITLAARVVMLVEQPFSRYGQSRAV